MEILAAAVTELPVVPYDQRFGRDVETSGRRPRVVVGVLEELIDEGGETREIAQHPRDRPKVVDTSTKPVLNRVISPLSRQLSELGRLLGCGDVWHGQTSIGVR